MHMENWFVDYANEIACTDYPPQVEEFLANCAYRKMNGALSRTSDIIYERASESPEGFAATLIYFAYSIPSAEFRRGDYSRALFAMQSMIESMAKAFEIHDREMTEREDEEERMWLAAEAKRAKATAQNAPTTSAA